MNDASLTLIVTLVLSILSALGAAGFFSNRFQRRRLSSEARQYDAAADVALSDAAIRLLGPYKTQNADLQTQVTLLNDRVRHLEHEVEASKRHEQALRAYIQTHFPYAKDVPSR